MVLELRCGCGSAVFWVLAVVLLPFECWHQLIRITLTQSAEQAPRGHPCLGFIFSSNSMRLRRGSATDIHMKLGSLPSAFFLPLALSAEEKPFLGLELTMHGSNFIVLGLPGRGKKAQSMECETLPQVCTPSPPFAIECLCSLIHQWGDLKHSFRDQFWINPFPSIDFCLQGLWLSSKPWPVRFIKGD